MVKCHDGIVLTCQFAKFEVSMLSTKVRGLYRKYMYFYEQHLSVSCPRLTFLHHWGHHVPRHYLIVSHIREARRLSIIDQVARKKALIFEYD